MDIMKFMLFFRLLIPLALIGLLVYFANEPNMVFTDKAPFIIGGLGIWAIYSIYKIFKWLNFSVTLSNEGISVNKQFNKWENIKSYKVQTATNFDDYIILQLKNGDTVSIPAGIKEKNYILGIIKNHIANV